MQRARKPAKDASRSKKGAAPDRTNDAAVTSQPPTAAHLPRVVGIGGSAGGLDAFRELLRHLPTDTGMAFVIVQHLSRDQKSMLPDILSRSTRMPVVELGHLTQVRADHVYVMAADTEIEYEHGTFSVRKRGAARKHMPVDRVFSSLAEGLGDLSIGVVLSGADGDGTIGLQRIKAVGGVTFAQDASAQFPSMPQSAIEHGAADFVLSPAKIAEQLADIADRPVLSSVDPPRIPADEFDRIIELLNAAEKVDFLQYKSPTIERRIQRRMLLRNIDDIAVYRRALEDDLSEQRALYRDVLIGVTRFFRDPSRTAALRKKVFPSLLQRAESLRIWVPGCSTGEEVYSLAITLLEFMRDQKPNPDVQIFGSDVNADSIAFARTGVYPKSIESAVSAERLERFFTVSAAGFSVTREIRELCIFAEHNLLKDPPFSRLDLICCSNLLIYLQPAQQQRVTSIFRYALNENGLLMLGPSESLRANGDGFTTIDRKHKIFRVAPGRRPRLEMPLGRSKHIAEGAVTPETPVHRDETTHVVDRLLLARYAPPTLVVNDASEAVEFRGDLQPFLAPASGAPSFKLSKLLHDDLLVHVRTALFKARHNGESVRREHLKMTRGKESRFVTLEVLPASGPLNERLFVITFELDPLAASDGVTKKRKNSSGAENDQLHEALAAAHGYLAHLTSEHEESDSVLNSTAEEVQSANQELQSTVEELETAKEELQSTNEELSTLNDELRVRNTDLVVLGDDLMNLLASIDTPVIMVDRDLLIRLFNPTAERLFSFQPSDAGRPINAFKPLLALPDLAETLHLVIETPTVINTDVQSREGRWYSLRIRPYRSSRNVIAGAVITLVDIHELRSALAAAEVSRDVSEGARTMAEDARTDALEANRLKDEFLSTLSHELRTPMTSILGWAQMMRMTTLDSETTATAIATIERGTHAQIRLIDDLLDISRITTGRLRLEPRSFRVRALIEETLDVVRPAIEARRIKVSTDLDSAPPVLYGDPDRLRQVIWNLLSNSVKFTPENGTVEISASHEKGFAYIRVRDSGEGIDPEFLPRIFERFMQVEQGTKRTKSGLGLGLAISKYVVDLHGGTITAESRGAGRGSTFTVSLPLVINAGETAHSSYGSRSEDWPSLKGNTVLVVDDDDDSRMLIAVALKESGATVISVNSVQAAIEAFEQSRPGVIVSDIAMPTEDGVDLLRRVRALPGPGNDIPLIALTAYTSDDDRRRILAAGFAEHVAKPVAPLTLVRVVAAVVARDSVH